MPAPRRITPWFALPACNFHTMSRANAVVFPRDAACRTRTRGTNHAGRGAGRNIMASRIEHSIDVNVPVRVAYNQWTQFQEFPRFMEGVREVRQLTDRRLRWRADIGGTEKTWEAEITEQIPDARIAWRSRDG